MRQPEFVCSPTVTTTTRTLLMAYRGGQRVSHALSVSGMELLTFALVLTSLCGDLFRPHHPMVVWPKIGRIYFMALGAPLWCVGEDHVRVSHARRVFIHSPKEGAMKSSTGSTDRAGKARFQFVGGQWVPANEAARLMEAAQHAQAAMAASKLDRQLTEELRRGLQVRELCAQNVVHAASADGRQSADKEEARREAAKTKAPNARAKAEAAGRRAIREGNSPAEKAELLERAGFVAGEATTKGGRVFRHPTGAEVEVYGAAVDPVERAARGAMSAIGRVSREGGGLEEKAAAVLAIPGWHREGRTLVHETGAMVELRSDRSSAAPTPATTPAHPRHNHGSGKPRISGSLYRELKEAGKLVHSSKKKKAPEGKKGEKSKKEGKWK